MAHTTPLVGRSAEIERLDDELRRAAAGEFRSLLILGEPGLGKTRLAGDFVGRHAGAVLALSARGHPLATTDSFGLWAEALDRHLRHMDEDELRAICGGVVEDLGTLLRAVAAVGGSLPDREPPRHRLLQGLATVIGNLARRAPVVVVLDDAHQADPSSWRGLHYLAHDLADARVLVIVAARPNELAEHALATTVVHGLEQEDLLERLSLAPLELEQLSELSAGVLSRPPPAALVTWLGARSRGNPLFALGLLHALVDEGADLTAPRLQRIPEALAERIGQRLEALPAPARGTLELLSIVSRPAAAAELIRFSQLAGESLDGALDALVRSRWIVDHDHGQEPAFEISHPLIQEAIYQRIGRVRRRTLHRVVGHALLDSGRLGEAAPHWARSAQPGDREAIRVLCDAMRQAEEREAYRESLAILGALVELVPRGDARWVEVLDAISWKAEWVVDRRADLHALLGIQAMRELDAALAGFPDAGKRAVVKFRLASFLHWGTGELAEAEGACREALALFRQAGDRTSALLAENELAWIRGARGDTNALRLGAEAVVAAAEASDERFALIHALGALAWGAMTEGDFDRAAAAHARATTLAREENRVYRVTWCLVMRALSHALEGRGDDALARLAEARALNPRYEESVVLEWTIIANWINGDFPTALRHAREALARSPERLARRRGLGIAFAALAAVETDELREAQSYLRTLEATYEGRDWTTFTQFSRWAEAVLERRSGRLEEASDKLEDVSRRLVAMRAWAFVALPLLDLAELAAERRDAEVGRWASSTMAEIALHTDRTMHGGLSAMTSAWAQLAASNHEQAARHARSAAGVLADTSCRALWGRALDGLGRSLAPLDRRGAADAFQQAVTIFDAGGASWRRDRALQALRTLGTRGRRVAAALGSRTLTSREEEVVHLSVRGHTAQEIAGRLFISKRTVETHLANAYAKLGIRNKRELLQRGPELRQS